MGPGQLQPPLDFPHLYDLYLGGAVMLAVTPAHLTYWAVTFPSIIIVIFRRGMLILTIFSSKQEVSSPMHLRYI